MSATVYLVRHGEVEHHRGDVGITVRGHEQARRAADDISTHIDQGDIVYIYHAPVKRVSETAADIHQQLSVRFDLSPIQADESLCNVRFMAQIHGKNQIEEPSLLYAQITNESYFKRLSPACANFYRNFWASDDPMGYWLTDAQHSDGGAELPETVLNRLLTRLSEIFTANAKFPAHSHWIMVTHSGALRVFLRHAFGSDPGEPDFCGIVTLEPLAQSDHVVLSYQYTTRIVMLQGLTLAPHAHLPRMRVPGGAGENL